MEQSTKSVNLARARVACGCHVCAFFHSRDDEYEILLPFLKEGLGSGDKAIHIIDKEHRAERFRRLANGGIDANAAEQDGQIEMRSWENAYLRGARFDQDAMLALIEEVLSAGKQQGFALTRLWANMEWALEDLPGVHDILEYESRLNYILPKYNDAVVCTYDLAKFSAAVVMDILRTHPQVIVGGILRENSFYVPPEEFLRELRDRKNAVPH
jgi:MEDS: MEthanogen/methylotroph, DcmR Sensory domain